MEKDICNNKHTKDSQLKYIKNSYKSTKKRASNSTEKRHIIITIIKWAFHIRKRLLNGPRGYLKWPKAYGQILDLSCPQRNANSKSQHAITNTHENWLKLKILTIPSVGKVWSKCGFHTWLLGMYCGTTTFTSSWVVTHQTEHRLLTL